MKTKQQLTNENGMVSILLAVTAMLISGCGPKQDPFIGTWTPVPVYKLEFKEDGTAVSTVLQPPAPPVTYKWTKSAAGKLVIEIPERNGHKAVKTETTAVVVGDTLTVTGKPGETVTYTRSK